MSALKDAREQLANDLRTALGVAVFSSWPDSITLPCLYVMPPLSTNYLTGGPNFGEYTALVDVVILAEHAELTESLEVLDTLLQAAVVNSADWTFISVETPAPIAVTESGADYLGTVLHLSKPVRFQ